jgi:hypothetical protein
LQVYWHGYFFLGGGGGGGGGGIAPFLEVEESLGLVVFLLPFIGGTIGGTGVLVPVGSGGGVAGLDTPGIGGCATGLEFPGV